MAIRKQQESRLEELFWQLQYTTDLEAQPDIEAEIWSIWMDSGSPSVDSIMNRGVEALSRQRFSEAIDLFSEVTQLMPQYAEGWNKRATAYYMRGDFKRSLEDIERTLFLENRHFGALSGKAGIFMEIQDYRNALEALQELKQILPHQPKIDQQIEEMYSKLGLRRS